LFPSSSVSFGCSVLVTRKRNRFTPPLSGMGQVAPRLMGRNLMSPSRKMGKNGAPITRSARTGKSHHQAESVFDAPAAVSNCAQVKAMPMNLLGMPACRAEASKRRLTSRSQPGAKSRNLPARPVLRSSTAEGGRQRSQELCPGSVVQSANSFGGMLPPKQGEERHPINGDLPMKTRPERILRYLHLYCVHAGS
jgi:hypothetical protein